MRSSVLSGTPSPPMAIWTIGNSAAETSVIRGSSVFCAQKARYEAYATARQWGWLSVNDIRDLENLNPVEGGDIYLQPLNMVQSGQDNTNVDAD